MTNSGGSWLQAVAASGTAGATPVNVAVTADRSLVAPGAYTGLVRVAANVHGHAYSQDVPVTFNKDAHWIYVQSDGVAFSKFPGRSVLTRSLKVVSTLGLATVPWTAHADQSWLSVTTNGVTGGDLVLTADPSGLAGDQEYLANVTVTSSDASVLNTQTVRVGLYIGSTDPVDASIAAAIPNVAANPVEPYLYTNQGDADITVYDVYSGALLRTFAGAVAQAGHMTVSSDGRILFVDDLANLFVVSLDAETGARIRTYNWFVPESTGMSYLRPSGHPILVTSEGTIYDVETGSPFSARAHSFGAAAVDPYSRFLYFQVAGTSSADVTQYSIRYSALSSDPINVSIARQMSYGGSGQDICASADGLRVYPVAGNQDSFAAFDTADLLQAQTLPVTPGIHTNSCACGWNGIFAGGANTHVEPIELWLFRPDGSYLTSFGLHPSTFNSVVRRTLVLSGDNTRLIGTTDVPSLDFRSAPTP